MICSYCGTEGLENICSFCGANLNIKRPTLKEFVVLEDVEKPFNELSCFYTYDLLVLLRLVRKERTKAYDLMLTLKKAGKSPQIDQAMINYSEEQYGLYTKRMKVIEGFPVDRMDYTPKRVDDKLLTKLAERLQKECLCKLHMYILYSLKIENSQAAGSFSVFYNFKPVQEGS